MNEEGSEDVRDTHMEYGRPILDVQIGRAYGPDVVLWQLTSIGTKRVRDQTLPSSLPLKAYQILGLLEKLEFAEEDEIANHVDLSLPAMRLVMNRLVGFGYVQQVQRAEVED